MTIDTLQIHDTLFGKKRDFTSMREGKVQLFVCGPTVYDHSHLGHARCFVFFDVVTRHLKRRGFDVSYVQNITDIAKKIERRSREREVTPKELSCHFMDSYLEDMRVLGVDAVSKYALASDYMEEIQDQVRRLLESGHAYQTSEGVLFDVVSFDDFGGLVNSDERHFLTDPDKGETRKDARDFFLWRTNLESLALSWDSPWGRGMPGWHVEDTAITEKEFGPQYDIHGGGIDLIHPHHEAERAQMESLSGESPIVNYWMHVDLLDINGQKMSKSGGNCIYIRDFLEEYSPNTLRIFLLSEHYRSVLSYSEESIAMAGSTHRLLTDVVSTLKNLSAEGNMSSSVDNNDERGYRLNRFNRFMNDDFDTASAVGEMREYLEGAGQELTSISPEQARIKLDDVYSMTSVLGIRI